MFVQLSLEKYTVHSFERKLVHCAALHHDVLCGDKICIIVYCLETKGRIRQLSGDLTSSCPQTLNYAEQSCAKLVFLHLFWHFICFLGLIFLLILAYSTIFSSNILFLLFYCLTGSVSWVFGKWQIISWHKLFVVQWRGYSFGTLCELHPLDQYFGPGF